MNPVIIKELRQTARSKFAKWIILLFPLAQIVCVAFVIISSSYAGKHILATTPDIGSQIFKSLLLLFIICVFLTSVYTGVRMAYERSDNNLDLFYITAIRSGAIIRGKLLAALIIVLLFFSLSLPYMMFTYMLRGIDLTSIFVVLILNLLATIILTQAAIFVATIELNKYVKIILGVIVTFIGFFIFKWIVEFSTSALVGGMWNQLGTWLFNKKMIIITSVCLTVWGLLHALSIANITPLHKNRRFAGNIYFLSIFILSGTVWACINIIEKKSSLKFSHFFAPCSIIISTALLAGVIERERTGTKTWRNIVVTRLPLWVLRLYNGKTRIIIWLILMTIPFLYFVCFPTNIIGLTLCGITYISTALLLCNFNEF